LNQYWFVVRRRKLLIFACVAGGLLLAVALNELSTPVYRSSVRLEVEREATRSPLTGAVTESPTTQSDNQALLTTAQLVTTRTPMGQVVAALDAKGVALETAAAPSRFSPMARSTPSRSGPAGVAEKVDWLLAHVMVEPLRDTRLIRISAYHSSPAAAAEIANTVAENFVRYHLSQRSAADNSVAGYLRVQAEEIRTRIQELERQGGGPGQGTGASVDSRIQQLTATAAELNASVAKATSDRLAIQSQLDRVRRVANNPAMDLNEIPIHTEALDAIRRDLLVSNTALAKAREIYGANHPKLVALNSENEDLRRSLRIEINNSISNLESQRSILAGREANLTAAIGQVERNLNASSNVESELKSDRELYSLLMARVREAEITGQLTGPVVRIVEPASIEPEAVRPRKALNIVIGFLLGLLSGAGLAFLLESLRRTIRTPKDVGDALQLPVLGLIPKDALR
jgi:succinoglycan biosynthesis transport protein ExoP